MSEIPDDIWKAAGLALGPKFFQDAQEAIALAIWAERKRCSRIAQEWGENVSTIAFAGPPPTLEQAANLIAESISSPPSTIDKET